MHTIYLLLVVCLTVIPILIAWAKGDRILDALARRQRIRSQLRRRRITRSLPVRADIVEALLKAEERRDTIEDRISQSLLRFREFSAPGPSESEREDGLEQTAQLLLLRESRFNAYRDLAWLQSETIEALAEEADALRKVAGIGDAASRPPQPEAASRETPAAALLESLSAAAARRQAVDHRLRGIRQGPEGPNRFDATVT